MSLGGYWPWDYWYQRYYWYGYHPYHWYGYTPDAYKVEGETYNYYTYNYDTDAIDHTTFQDVRDRLADQQAREPADVTEADYLFEAAVKAFEAGDYTLAITNFEKAATLEPDDVVLGFARVQAFFADGQYDRAAQVLRESIGKMPVDKEGVFFPRGLYTNDDVLLGQVSRLEQESNASPLDSDRKLLLGYQLLGLEKYGQAVGPLKAAAIDQKNKSTAESLLKLLEKIETDAPGKTGK